MLGNFTQLIGDVAKVRMLSKIITNRTVSELKTALEKSALEAEAIMKRGIARQEFGLAPNTALTQELKGGNIPLVASSQLVQNITTSELGREASEAFGQIMKRLGDKTFGKMGSGDVVEAYFVGVKRTAPQYSSGTSQMRLGKYRSISLYNIARLMVKGYTAVLPRIGVKKKVPKRDFVTPTKKAHAKRHRELMEDSVGKVIRLL